MKSGILLVRVCNFRLFGRRPSLLFLLLVANGCVLSLQIPLPFSRYVVITLTRGVLREGRREGEGGRERGRGRNGEGGKEGGKEGGRGRKGGREREEGREGEGGKEGGREGGREREERERE